MAASPIPAGGSIDGSMLDDIIGRLLNGGRANEGKQVQLSETEIRHICVEARRIFLSQPNLLHLRAPINVCALRFPKLGVAFLAGGLFPEPLGTGVTPRFCAVLRLWLLLAGGFSRELLWGWLISRVSLLAFPLPCAVDSREILMAETILYIVADLWEEEVGFLVRSFGEVFNGPRGGSSFLEVRGKSFKEKPLTINKGGLTNVKPVAPIVGKGKEIVVEGEFKSPKFLEILKANKPKGNLDSGASSSTALKISKQICFAKDDPVLQDNSIVFVRDEQMKDDRKVVRQCNSEDLNMCDQDPSALPSKNDTPGNVMPNVWNKKPNTRVDNLELGSFLMEDGKTVKLNAENEYENSKKLQNSLVVKVFGENIPFHVISIEIRRQWSRFAKFHLTMLGLDWVLCSFFDSVLWILFYLRDLGVDGKEVVDVVRREGDLSSHGLAAASVPGEVLVDGENVSQNLANSFSPVNGGVEMSKSGGLNSSSHILNVNKFNLLSVIGEVEDPFQMGGADKIVEVENLVVVEPGDGGSPKDVVEGINLLRLDVCGQCEGDSSFVKRKLANELKGLGPIKLFPRSRKIDLGSKGNWGDDPPHVLGMAVAFWNCREARKSKASLYLKEFVKDFVVVFVVWRISTVYGSKEVGIRRVLWRDIELYSSKDIPSVVGGDFNCLLAKGDKKGRKRFIFSQCSKDMKAFVTNNDFHEVGFIGPRFTWCNNKVGGAQILERLDRCYLTSSAIGSSQLMVVRHLARIASDHCPIMINLLNQMSKAKKVIRFEDIWASYHASGWTGWPSPLTVLDDDDRKMLEAELSLEEVMGVVRELKGHKSLGVLIFSTSIGAEIPAQGFFTLESLIEHVLMFFNEDPSAKEGQQNKEGKEPLTSLREAPLEEETSSRAKEVLDFFKKAQFPPPPTSIYYNGCTVYLKAFEATLKEILEDELSPLLR
ncbi:hypothetical protein M5K25_000567 [Dendrobium thyrsiflorum]|uniref:protein-serine/threonine phosphatase n=1 Tax=Dendrobium thyrsiflorum TaxID=117978 RepID=A0ABD0VVT1_DENTH